jgi:hypothetical protein
MTMFSFGSGTLVAKRTDLANQPVALLAVTQDWSIDIDQELIKLVGQSKFPVDIAPGENKIAGKIKFARVQATTISNMILAQTVTPASGFQLTGPENHSAIAATTFTVTNGATFTEDCGVFYHGTGIALAPVTAAPTAGQYIAGVAGTGTYTINSADESVSGGLDLFYTNTLTTENQITITNPLMGTGSIFKLIGTVPYKVQNVQKQFSIQLNAARCSKMPFAFGNKKYMIPEMDYEAFADASNTIGTFSITE